MNRELKKILIVMWLVIAVSFSSLLVYGILNNNESRGFFSFLQNSMESTLNIQKDENIEISSINKINVDFSSSNIIVLTTDELKMRVVQKSSRKLSNDEKFTVTNENNEVTIKRSNSRRIFSIFSFGNSEKIELYIPKSYNKDLNLHSSSGNIEFISEIAIGNLSCIASSGNLVGDNNITTKDINLNVSSGNIDFASLISNNYKIEASSGNIKINSLSGSGELQTTSGNIKAKYKDISEYSKATVGSGNVDLIIPKSLSFEFSGNCSSGNINSNFDLNYKNKKGNEATAKVGNGPYKKIDVKASSGNISVSN